MIGNTVKKEPEDTFTNSVQPEFHTFFDNLLTMDDLLAMLRNQYSRRTIYRWIHEGMPCKKIRSRLWFPKDEVASWLERSR
jgi:predicted DNA-binding transcriptional regulator AlpA